jgi:uncharacterized protein YceH (UPF0502 family)
MEGSSDPQPRPAAHARPAAVRELSGLEARVLGVLVEKQHTVPDSYPLTLNALAAGCSQKTSRDPVMSVTEAEVQATIDGLRSLSLTIETSGGRVMRYAHNMERVLDVPSQAVALLATLMLRGSQTLGELRSTVIGCTGSPTAPRSRRSCASSPAGAGALAAELPRQPGARESRWAHLLSGAPPSEPARAPAPGRRDGHAAEFAALKDSVRQLERELDALKSELASLRAKST